jgi:hypothetical protein
MTTGGNGMKKQMRNNRVSCLASQCDAGGFPPYQYSDGRPVREHSYCEVLDDESKKVVAIYLLHSGQWYRYDLVGVWPPYPPQPLPPEPLFQTISVGLVVPGVPNVLNPVTGVLSPTPVSVSVPVIGVPTMPVIDIGTEV